MPSGALNEFECTVDGAACNHQTHFQQSGDVCWKVQRDSRPESPVRVTGSDLTTNGNNDPSTQPVISPTKEDGIDSSSSLRGNVKGNKDELAKIREGFDAWLAAFRKSRPHRDVIWRVGKNNNNEQLTTYLQAKKSFFFVLLSICWVSPTSNFKNMLMLCYFFVRTKKEWLASWALNELSLT